MVMIDMPREGLPGGSIGLSASAQMASLALGATIHNGPEVLNDYEAFCTSGLLGFDTEIQREGLETAVPCGERTVGVSWNEK